MRCERGNMVLTLKGTVTKNWLLEILEFLLADGFMVLTVKLCRIPHKKEKDWNSIDTENMKDVIKFFLRKIC